MRKPVTLHGRLAPVRGLGGKGTAADIRAYNGGAKGEESGAKLGNPTNLLLLFQWGELNAPGPSYPECRGRIHQ
jgi:hypothetical protein